jgi:hypothetical protein
MIKNERQLAVTKTKIEVLRQALADLPSQREDLADPLKAAQKDALESQLVDLREEVRDYEALLSGSTRILRKRPLAELSQALIEARVASGLTQKQLAERLEMKEQQIQRYEATDYISASHGRILDVVDALDGFIFICQLEQSRAGASNLPPQNPGPTSVLLTPGLIRFEEPPWAASRLGTGGVISANTYFAQRLPIQMRSIGMYPVQHTDIFLDDSAGMPSLAHRMAANNLEQNVPQVVVMDNWVSSLPPFAIKSNVFGVTTQGPVQAGRPSSVDLKAVVGGQPVG